MFCWSRTGDNRLTPPTDDRTLHELYLWPFADGIKAGAANVITTIIEPGVVDGRLDRAYAHANSAGVGRDVSNLPRSVAGSIGVINDLVRQSLSDTRRAAFIGKTEEDGI